VQFLVCDLVVVKSDSVDHDRNQTKEFWIEIDDDDGYCYDVHCHHGERALSHHVRYHVVLVPFPFDPIRFSRIQALCSQTIECLKGTMSDFEYKDQLMRNKPSAKKYSSSPTSSSSVLLAFKSAVTYSATGVGSVSTLEHHNVSRTLSSKRTRESESNRTVFGSGSIRIHGSFHRPAWRPVLGNKKKQSTEV
jgi:hypothetical protein